MRVTFIVPPSGFLLDEKVFPTLGVLKIAAVLEAQGMDVDVLDLSGVSDAVTATAAHVAERPAAVYGLTATTPQLPIAAALADQIRQSAPTASVLLGGPHVTLMNASARQEQAAGQPSRATQAMAQLAERFDVLVCGDGERAIGAALVDDPPGLIDADVQTSPMFLTGADLDRAPFAARHLIDLSSYHYQIDGRRAHSLICQLGCPFGCRFCGGRQSPFLRRIRTRSTARVIDEMRHLYQTYGTTGFMFFDDELNVNKLFMDLLAQMVALQDEVGTDFRMRGFIKAELLTPEMASAMYAAGFRQVLVGFESGSPRILQNIQKKATVDDNTRCVDLLQSQGVEVKAAMSFGHPGESDETIEATRRWLLATGPKQFDVTIITVYPGTPYYDYARPTDDGIWTYTEPKNGDRLHAFDVDYLHDAAFYKGTPGDYRSFVYTDALTPDDLCQRRDAVEAEVRSALAIPYPTAQAAVAYEHSMGMGR